MSRGGRGAGWVVAPALVGRAEELERLATAVAAPPVVVVVDGEAGIGKTRLVTELAARPEVTGRRLLVGRCHRIRESFPLGPVVEALRGAADQLAGTALSPVAGALRPLLPELAGRLPPAPAPLDDRAAERHLVFRGLVELLAGLGPAVLVLEDLHWADGQTADFVGYLLAGVPADLAVVLTFRGQEVNPGLRAATARRSPGTGRAELLLAPLDPPATGALAAAIVGVERVSEEFADYLCERTAGLPFAVEELLALLRTRGDVARQGGGWARRELAELTVPSGIRDQVAERIGHLTADARSVVVAAAVLQVPVPAPVLLATSGLAAGRAARAVDEALGSGLLVEHGPQLGLRHPLAAQAVYEATPGVRRRELHARAATTLRALTPPPLGQLAHHLRHADRWDEWPAAAERAADQAVGLGHDEAAARLLEEVLRHAPLDPERRGRLAVKLGRVAVDALRAATAVDLVSAALQTEPTAPGRLPRELRGELRLVLGRLIEHTGGDPVRLRQLWAGAVEDLDHRPDLQAWAMVALGIPMVAQVPAAEHRSWLDRAVEILPAVTDPVDQLHLRGKVAMVLAALGDPSWRAQAEQITARTGGAPRQRREVTAYWSVGLAACFAGHHETAGRLLSTGLAAAVGCGSRRLELTCRSSLALLDYCRGDWSGLAERVATLVDEVADDPGTDEVVLVAGCLALARGEVAPAHRWLEPFLRRDSGAYDVVPFAVGAWCRAALARGDLAGALASIRRVVAVIEASGAWAAAMRALPAVAETMVATGEVAAAGALVDRCERELAGSDAPLAPAALEHARGVLAAAAGRGPEAARRFRAAAHRYQRLTCPYEAAQANERAAEALLAATPEDAPAGGDRPAIAGPALQAALAEYLRLGASWDAARATSTARRYGVPVPARHRGGRRGYGDRMSPREREVADLAATGRTNKEIAAELFLSTRTVEKHVLAVMRKLGASTRAGILPRLVDHANNGGIPA
ncbi:MAG: AAA family ATPase [Micromonosporaceae bacterium]|nr:AAA family ATPase [Micromonosporaceae bacterium]